MGMKARSTIRRIHNRLDRALTNREGFATDCQEAEAYGARQALGWALGDNCMAPDKCVGIATRNRGEK